MWSFKTSRNKHIDYNDDHYCDGIIDCAETTDPCGADEFRCSDRFFCSADTSRISASLGDYNLSNIYTKISIPLSKVCDGVIDCANGLDEDSFRCHTAVLDDTDIFSSSTELIASRFLQYAVLIMGLFAVFANMVCKIIH